MLNSQSEVQVGAQVLQPERSIKHAPNSSTSMPSTEQFSPLLSAQIQVKELKNLQNSVDAYRLGHTGSFGIDSQVFDQVDTVLQSQGDIETYVNEVAAEVRRTKALLSKMPGLQTQLEFQQARSRAYALWLRQRGFTGKSISENAMRKVKHQLEKDRVPLASLIEQTEQLKIAAEKQLQLAERKAGVDHDRDAAEIAAHRSLLEVQIAHRSELVKKPDVTDREMTRWATSDKETGYINLVNRPEMEQKYRFKEFSFGNIVFIASENSDIATFQKLIQRAKKTEKIIGAPPKTKKTIYITLIPESKYFPGGGGTDPNNEQMILDATLPNLEAAFAHEYTHVHLGQTYGTSKSLIALEGAAVYFQRLQFPNDPNHSIEYTHGYDEVLNINARNRKVGLSHTAMLENADHAQIDTNDQYKFAYRYGGYFAEFLVERFGKETFLKFYAETCVDNLFDTQGIKSIIANGVIQSGARYRDITAAALKNIGLNPDKIEADFDIFIKNKPDSDFTGKFSLNTVVSRLRKLVRT